MNISLYPEKSREDLELDYHQFCAALRVAATDLLTLGGHQASEDLIIWKIGELLDRSVEMATKSAAARYQRVLMGTAKPIVHLLLAALFFAGIARAQDHASPRKVDFALYAADAGIRALDAASTHALLASPCRCFHEDDPIAPRTGSLAPLLGFQAGMSYGAIAGGRRLAAHGHPRLGRLLLLADIASEVWAVQHNLRQHEPVAQGLAQRLEVSR